jgi:hypothetical protein
MFRTERERECYRALHTGGEAALEALVGDVISTDLINRWADAGMLRVKNLDPGRAPKPLVLMNADERAAWNAHVIANTGYTIKTFAKYAH